MSLIDCGRCGRKTNTAVCDWIDATDTGKALRCYAALENGKWVPGCAVNDEDAPRFNVDFARKIIAEQE